MTNTSLVSKWDANMALSISLWRLNCISFTKSSIIMLTLWCMYDVFKYIWRYFQSLDVLVASVLWVDPSIYSQYT